MVVPLSLLLPANAEASCSLTSGLQPHSSTPAQSTVPADVPGMPPLGLPCGVVLCTACRYAFSTL